MNLGEWTSADIIHRFAADEPGWQKVFFRAWEKMQLNGYTVEELDQAPSNGDILAPYQ